MTSQTTTSTVLHLLSQAADGNHTQPAALELHLPKEALQPIPEHVSIVKLPDQKQTSYESTKVKTLGRHTRYTDICTQHY